MKFNTIFLIVITSFSSVCIGNTVELSAASQLRRASYLLQGRNADNSDFIALSKLETNSDKKQFIADKIDSYLSDQRFVNKMNQRLNELFRVHIGYHNNEENERDYDRTHDGSMNQLFIDLIGNNLSWDTLLTQKEYKLSVDDDMEDPRGLSDGAFYDYNSGRDLVGEIQEYLKSIEEEGPSSDGSYDSSGENSAAPYVYKPDNSESSQALAGVLTTNRFYTRFPTTRLNKNRKRAAAIFRVFLCDSMTPVLTVSNEENNELLKMATGESALNTDMASLEARHGEDPQCKACHYKLDPAAQTYIGSATFPNRTGSPGALVYRRADGSMVNVPVNGIGELGEAITEQPEYLQCQVQHFWDWFVGSDIPLTESKKLDLASTFDNLGRKPKDFIKHLILSDDFAKPETLKLDDIRYSHVKPIFQRCDSCHQSAVGAPILGQGYPYAKDSIFNDFILGQAIWASDLKEQSAKDYMPPSNAGWKLEGFERELIKAWVKGGAKTDDGQITIDENSQIFSARDQISLSGIIDENLRPRFGLSYMRYSNNYDTLDTVFHLFSNGRYSNYGDCRIDSYDDAQRMTLGVLNPSSGKSLFVKPSPELIDLVRGCIEDASKNMMRGVSIGENDKGLLSDAISQNYSNVGGLYLISWKNLSRSEKLSQVTHTIEFMIGKGVLSDQTLADFTSNLFSSIELLDSETQDGIYLDLAIQKMLGVVGTSSEFLTY